MQFFFNVTKTIFFFLLCYNCSYGQSYGLSFLSHKVIQDKRTSLDLSPNKTFNFDDNFELSFDLSFYKTNTHLYGYITRIIENDKRNIDIVYNTDSNCFNVIIGEHFSKIEFKIDKWMLFNQWNKLKLKFDFDNDRLIFYAGNRLLIESGVHLKRNASYKIIFGVNNYKQFQTTDVPPMKLRDIRIIRNKKLKYNWPLNELTGTVAHEVVSKSDASVINPVWILAKHYDWQLAQSLTVNGIASVAFNPREETLYITGSDSLYSYTLNTSKWNNTHLSAKIILSPGNQSIYDPYNNNLYNFFVDKKLVNRYNFKKSAWEKKLPLYFITNHLDINNMVCSVDTSLYFFGGYGQHIYKNDVSKYSLKSKKWENVKTKGDFFTPRYLSALGTSAKGDTAYIIGGYGDSTGQQVLNPKALYDMMRFTVKDKTFKKCFEIKNNGEDFTFANSLIINDKEKKYYALIFPQNRYQSKLQLIAGSLANANYSRVGSVIPYSFHDTNSFADLYYDPVRKMFIAVTLLRADNGTTRVNIYTLLGPPYGVMQETATTTNKIYQYLIIGLALIGIWLFFAIKKRTKPQKLVRGLFQETIDFNTLQNGNNNISGTTFIDQKVFKNSILLFGGLQVFDAEGTEITKYFTPLIKELFLIVLIYSIRWGRGLSSEELNEILWSDKDVKSARNNRSVNIAKLKSLLDRMAYCHLSKNTGYWKMDIDYNHIYVDYNNYLNIVKEKGQLDIKKIKCLSVITQRGGFLSNIDYEWLDTFKSEISNEVIDTYLHFAQDESIEHDPDFLVQLSNFIFYFDPVNEDAMIIKCKALFSLGKHSLAKNEFENFTKEYKTIYGEDFKMDFHAILL